MSESIKSADHVALMRLLKGDMASWSENADRPKEIPSSEYVNNAAQRWHNAGMQAEGLAKGLEDGLSKLIGEDAWKGKSADAFRETANQVIWFAREVAHMCDDQAFQKPPPPKKKDDAPFDPPPADDSNKAGFKKCLSGLASAIKYVENDDNVPRPRWWKQGSGWHFETYYSSDPRYEVKNGAGDVIKGGWTRDEMDPKLDKLGIQTVTHDAPGIGTGDLRLPVTAAGHELLYIELGLNRSEASTAGRTRDGLVQAYTEAQDRFPKPPQPPELGLKPAADGGAGGAGTGGGTGGLGGGGSAPGLGGGGSSTSPFPGPGGPGPDGQDGPNTDPQMPDDPSQPDVPNGPGDPNGPNGPNGPNDPKDPKDPMGPVHVPDENWDPGRNGPTDKTNPNGPQPPSPIPDQDWHPDDESRDGWDPGNPRDDSDLGGDSELSRVGGLDGSGGLGQGGGSSAGGPGTGVGGGTSPSGGGSGVTAGATSSGPSGIGNGLAGGGGRAGGGMGGMGMMPMMGGAGAGAGGGDADRNTWLDEETDDVWGVGDDSTEMILGGGDSRSLCGRSQNAFSTYRSVVAALRRTPEGGKRVRAVREKITGRASAERVAFGHAHCV